MDAISQVEQYISHLREKPYAYELQKESIELFLKFLRQDSKYKNRQGLSKEVIDYFLAFWVPRYKRYLDDLQSYHLVYTLDDILTFVSRQDQTAYSLDLVEAYGEEYIRLYRTKQIIANLSGSPIMRYQPLVINLETYKEYKKKRVRKDSMSLYEKGHFIVEEINTEGYIVFKKTTTNKCYKVLFRPTLLHHFKLGDVLHITLKKKIFFIYWEIDEIITYYPRKALNYLS